MKGGTLFIVLGLLFGLIHICIGIIAYYDYQTNVVYAWDLADKSSTLEAKSMYITEFINNLERTGLAEYNAIIFKTPNNNIQRNLNALKTLKTRLDEIKDLDVESFAYQTAIQQITAQEQGEAQEMLSVLSGGWELENYPIIWDWICIGLFVIWFLMIAGGTFFNQMR